MNKNLFFAALAAVCLAACTHADPEQETEEGQKDVTFEVRPDGWTITMEPIANTRTRALDADGKAMTDVWVLDYKNGTLVQQIHQTSADADFGQPTLPLSYGSHDVYFIASRGKDPVLSTDAHTITFSKVLDSFYRHLSLTVTSATQSQAVSLARCVTKLQLVFSDAIPDDAATFNVTPATWYYGINYQTGAPTAAASSQTVTVNIPDGSKGKSGESVNVYGFSGATEWTTDIAISCVASDESVLGAATIAAVPFAANRVSQYTGSLFSGDNALTLSLLTEWDTPYTGTW